MTFIFFFQHETQKKCPKGHIEKAISSYGRWSGLCYIFLLYAFWLRQKIMSKKYATEIRLWTLNSGSQHFPGGFVQGVIFRNDEAETNVNKITHKCEQNRTLKVHCSGFIAQWENLKNGYRTLVVGRHFVGNDYWMVYFIGWLQIEVSIR
jgi:hypothetical protein